MLRSHPNVRSFLESRYLIPGCVVVGVAASCLLYLNTARSDSRRLDEDLNRRTDSRHALIRAKIDGHSETLRSFARVFSVFPALKADAFQRLSREAVEQRPGLKTLLWAPWVPDGARGQWQRTRQPITEFDSAGQLALAEKRPEYFPTQYAFPSAPFESCAGLDLGRTELSAALNRARKSGSLTATELIALPPANRSTRGIALVHPVFSAPAKDSSDAGTLVGVLAAFLQPDELVRPGAPTFAGPVFEILGLDTSVADPAKRVLFYFSGSSDGSVPAESEFRRDWFREMPLQVGDRNWLLLYRTREGWLDAHRSSLPPLLLVGGVVITLLFTALLHNALRRASLIEKQVQERTAELRATQRQLEDDIREREAMEDLLRVSEQQLHGLMENSPSAIFVKDIDGRYLTVNRRFTELHGRSRTHFIGFTDVDLFPPEIATRARKSDIEVAESAQSIELEEVVQLADGARTSLVHKFPLIDLNGAVQGICGIATDITERKRAEAEVRESRRQLESLLGQLPGMAFRFIDDGKLSPTYVSRGAARLTGYTAREFLERQITLDEIIHPEDRTRTRNAIAAAVKTRRAFELEYRLVDRSGKVKWVLERGQGVFDESGRLLFVEGLAIDITQRKDAEAEKLLVERRLLEGQKLESIGVLAGGIAHDFNNLLTGIIGNASLTSLELPAGSPLRQNLRQIEIASQRAAELCQQMLAYAGKGRFIIQPVDLSALVTSTVPLLKASISKRARLQFQLDNNLPAIMADPTQMRQLVMNLVLNASEALGELDGDIIIATSLVRSTLNLFEGAALVPPEPAGEFLRLEVRDTGSGMSHETVARIFEPFFTTKFAGRGLGLAAVLGIIRSHRGGLTVRSVLGQGSTFALYLPAETVAKQEAPAPREASAAPWRTEGRVLVVDDEDQVLKVTSGMLKTCGLTAVAARDGYEAIDLFRTEHENIDLVLLDMTMPRLSGEETLPLLREIDPDVRVLFMSGYNRREVVDALGGRGSLAFMQKPFTLEKLRENLRGIMP